jgi:hypothetical protein
MSLILSGTDGLSDVDGTAATPAIRGTDTNTGIFFPAADTIAFSEGGAESMRIDSSGNVGIGTTSPSVPLQVRVNNTSGVGVRIQGRSSDGYGSIEYRNSANDTAYGFLDVNNAAMYFGTVASIPNIFYTSNAERMRIDSSGRLLISTTATTPGYFNTSTGTQISNGVIYTSSAGGSVFGNPTSGGGVLMSFGTVNNWNTGTISTNNNNTAYNTSSDYRLKENIAPMTGALATVQALKPVTYKWKVDGSNGEGFIAHELQEVCPLAVTGEKDAMQTQQYEVSPAIPATYDEEGNELTPAVEAVIGEREVPKYQGIDTSFLVATLTAAIQELKATVDAQAARIAALEAAS